MATYWDPFQEMDRLFGSLALNNRNAPTMPMDLFREGDHYVLAVDLPGIDPGSIDVSCEDRTLTIRAERTPRSAEGQWLLRERQSGTVARQLTLGRGLALDQISASYADGVLTLTIPVSEEARPRRIEVSHSAGTPTAIEAGS
ncbi:Hsp20/alpha crystallin family protein [Isoptericola sp. NEAU-Y5]|uniref:Hsp20/alpha crystallin family protein n=1 Tax=Isoptericola luteus TaxID=2879484 RepID=A0ABS7ZEB9_9MICO|nr:Hsp20/alpha crystallin family protein [Isoptericola sp. NEAU-Y5]MCA5892159.1 Hsp20/alpha crystallin family protein [Isoptericola sp. NEAU-Y5]